MPASTALTHAQSLVDAVCACIAELDLEDCADCYARDDLCCDPIIGWGDSFDVHCATVFVNFLGTQPADVSGPKGCLNLTDLLYDVGISLCIPDILGTSNPVEDFNHFSECAMFLAEEVWGCLNSMSCECGSAATAGQIVTVSGISIDRSFEGDAGNVGSFSIQVAVRLS